MTAARRARSGSAAAGSSRVVNIISAARAGPVAAIRPPSAAAAGPAIVATASASLRSSAARSDRAWRAGMPKASTSAGTRGGTLRSIESSFTPMPASASAARRTTSTSALALGAPISSTPTWANWRSGRSWVPFTRKTSPA